MQMEFKLKRTLPVVSGLVFLWIIFLVSRFLLEAPENKNQTYIPSNSSLVMRIDGKHFLESAAYDLAYKTGDDDIFRQLDILSGRSTNRGKFRDAGINFLSDVIVFSQPLENSTVLGFIFNLSSADKFREAMPEIIGKNQAFATDCETGIFLTDPSKSIAREKLSAHAEKMFNANSRPAYLKNWTAKDGTFLNIELKNQPKSGISNGSLQAKWNASLLEFTGNLQSNEKYAFSSKSLKPDGFHVSAAILSQFVQDSLKNILAQNGFDFPDIARISVNYRGINLQNGTVPMADLLLEFESEIDPREIFENNPGWKNLGFAINENPVSNPASKSTTFEMKYGNISYTVNIIDEKTIFIGQKPENLVDVKREHLLLLKGDLTKITNVEGGGLFGMGINLYPPYRTGKEFLSAISSANVQIVPQKGKYVLDGKIQFKKDKYPLSESLKLIIGLSEI